MYFFGHFWTLFVTMFFLGHFWTLFVTMFFFWHLWTLFCNYDCFWHLWTLFVTMFFSGHFWTLFVTMFFSGHFWTLFVTMFLDILRFHLLILIENLRTTTVIAMSYYAVHRVANKLLNTFEIWNIQFSENKDSNGRALMHIFYKSCPSNKRREICNKTCKHPFILFGDQKHRI